MVELIITEKPAAAKKIAEALSDGKPKKEAYQGVPFFRIEHNGKEILVGSAVGHLFGLAEKEKTKNFAYPIFDIEWLPTFSVNKDAAFTKKYFDTLKKLAKMADSFTVATDYDLEGEVIGLNIVRFICNRNDAKRMKFSTLTTPDLVKAYANLSPHLDWGQAEAGETRHYLDYYYGINISRALTSAIKKAGIFKILSTGRVQGPALKLIVDKEKEIQAFKPEPFWQIELNGAAKDADLNAWHEKDKFWKEDEAQKVMSNIKGCKEAMIASVERKQFKQLPPFPFDLTTLQTEAYRCLGISPKQTLSIAQELYTGGFISYPRTSSQQLPPAIGFAVILKALGKIKEYADLAKIVLKKKVLTPNNGKKTDPAHPAIYPTGIAPKKLEDRTAKIYDLITKRFLATFGDPATRETMTIKVDAKREIFVTSGTRTVEKEWHILYEPYVKVEELELPAVSQGEKIKVKKITLHQKETQPPKRFTQSSIIRELEKRNLGTKATRAEIVDTLYRRNYVTGESVTATVLGIQVIEVLEKHCAKIVDEELTRHFELEMEEIREGKKKKEGILREARDVLTEILADFKKKEKEVGEGLKKTLTETKALLTTLGPCMICKVGSLVLRKGRFGRFAACDKYPECKTTFSLPSNGLIEVSKNVCEHCTYPMIKIIRKAKRPQEVCINKLCPSKKIEIKFEEKPCPTCKEGTLKLRRSVYGAFIGCSRYPKCRHIEKLADKEKASDKVKKEAKS